MFTVFNKEIPNLPGVYLMKKDSKIIYVGKAKNLERRVSSYFLKNHQDMKTKELVKNIDDIDYIICNTEIDALILENNLIKKYTPKYNINLKDSKTYPYIYLSKERFPKVVVIKTTKKVEKTGIYYGPYPKGAWYLQKILTNFFQVRDCKKDMDKIHIKPCLKYYMKRCLGPCIDKKIENEYNENIKKLKGVLEGNSKEVIKKLEDDMKKSSEKMEFEKAIYYREQIKELKNTIFSQVSDFKYIVDEDIFLIKVSETYAFLCVLNIRDGKIIDKNFMKLSLNEKIFDDLFLEILANYYQLNTIPKNLILEEKYEDKKSEIKNIFKNCFKVNINLFFPKIKSRRKELLDMGRLNLEKEIENEYNKKESIENGLKILYEKLKLKTFPYRIECFDISNIQGKDAVASMSVTIEGKAAKKEYRKFKILCKDTPDDFLMMKEVIYRRYSNLSKKEFPNLILIDGGLGQINSVGEILKELEKLEFCDLISIAKKNEEIYLYGENKPFIFSRDSETLKILQRTRDEAHRFGITFHRKLRSKRVISSELDKIEGIGEKRRNSLLKTFGSIKNIKEASIEELKKVIPESIAIKIKERLK